MDMQNMNYNYGYGTPATFHASSSNPALTLSFFLFFLACILIGYAIYSWLLGRIFHKAGLSKAIAWIPFYNNWKLLELGDQAGWWAILMIIPIVNYVATVFLFIAEYRVGLKLGKAGWWVILAIFVPIIWLAILAFDDSTWHKTVQAAKDAPKI